MRKTVLGMIALASILFCCLIAGTPVNNDSSPAAITAGIHLTPPPATARTAAAAVAPLLGGLVLAVVLAGAVRLTSLTVAVERAVPLVRTLVRARAGDRRGPPALAA